MSDPTISRRKALALAAGAAGAMATGAKLPRHSERIVRRSPSEGGSLKQSVCRWCCGDIALDDLCVAGKDMGRAWPGRCLVHPEGWPGEGWHGDGAPGSKGLRHIRSGAFAMFARTFKPNRKCSGT